MKVGILLIATNKYMEFIQPLVESIREFFLTAHDKTIFIFTNHDMPPEDGIEWIKIEHKPWPYMTLYRFRTFLSHADKLQDMDYLYYLDADMLVVESVGDEIFGKTVGTLHPGFYDKDNSQFTYDRNPKSKAYIPLGKGNRYYAGGFFGGEKEAFLNMSKVIDKWITSDEDEDYIAIWHDESHMNKFFFVHPPAVELSSSYCCIDYNETVYPRKILALTKNHQGFREE